MCIIIHKPKGIVWRNMEKDIYNSLTNNFDGMGIMYQENSQVIIKKGYFDHKEIIKCINDLGDITDRDLVFHARYATHGIISEGNCHPFPITTNIKELKAEQIKTNIGIVHNGIIPFCGSKKESLSDTQIFILKYLSRIPEHELMNNAAIHKLIDESTKSKFVLMNKNKITVVGKFINDKGVIYSNKDYKYVNIRYFQENNYCQCCGEYFYSKDKIFTIEGLDVCEYCYNAITKV